MTSSAQKRNAVPMHFSVIPQKDLSTSSSCHLNLQPSSFMTFTKHSTREKKRDERKGGSKWENILHPALLLFVPRFFKYKICRQRSEGDTPTEMAALVTGLSNAGMARWTAPSLVFKRMFSCILLTVFKLYLMDSLLMYFFYVKSLNVFLNPTPI